MYCTDAKTLVENRNSFKPRLCFTSQMKVDPLKFQRDICHQETSVMEPVTVMTDHILNMMKLLDGRKKLSCRGKSRDDFFVSFENFLKLILCDGQ